MASTRPAQAPADDSSQTGANRRRLDLRAAALFVVARAVVFAQMYLSRHNILIFPGDAGRDYFRAARHWTDGRLPYLDFKYEYPPGTLPLIKFDWLVVGDHRLRFMAGWIAMMLVLDVVMVVLLRRWRPGDWRPAVCWIVGTAVFGTSLYLRNDLLVIVAVALAVFLYARGHAASSGALLGVGLLAKLWPVVALVGVFLVWTGRRVRLATGAVAVVGVAVVIEAAAGIGKASVTSLVATQGNRPIELESMWALPTLINDAARGRHRRSFFTFGSFNVHPVRPWIPDLAYGVAIAVIVATVVTLALWKWRRPQTLDVPAVGWVLVGYTVLQVAAAPVISAQYVLWVLGAVCALLCVDPGRPAVRIAVLTVVVCALSQLVYPWLFPGLRTEQVYAIVALTVRNVGLLAIAGLAVRGAARRWRGGEPYP